MGSKDGMFHIGGVCQPWRLRPCTESGYPVYRTSTLFAEGNVYEMPLLAKNQFLPDLSAIPEKVAKAARLMFLNYPNNPTSAVTLPGFFEEAVDFALDHEILIVHDNAYSEIAFDGYQAPSFLSTKGAMETAIEMHSLSKTYMTGWRIGMACGNPDIITGLGRVKTNVDSGSLTLSRSATPLLVPGLHQAMPHLSERRIPS